MSNLPASIRKKLAEEYTLVPGRLNTELKGGDGTIKLGIELDDGVIIETVLLSDGKGRKTACISTQAGCPVGCVFCKTGTLGFRRNLSASEIAGQFLYLKSRAPETTHIVVMGMGEPLLNPVELRKAINFFTEEAGLNISKRRITISTCGIERGIEELLDKGPHVRLSLSLNSANEGLRKRLMPRARDSLFNLKNQLLKYRDIHRITLEVVLLRGINTGKDEARAITDYNLGLDAHINLIPWNKVEGLEFEGRELERPGNREIEDFASELKKMGLKVTVRMGKGGSISGACGQLGR
ncbi:MAG: 23S rRNA (adenine(2503)-C(2))-methyltransferase RlmN [Treponema sp.]|nr:23S rRNA (adenine(2503)-C(2))-methyltransferase RlmN [Treponema sp.]